MRMLWPMVCLLAFQEWCPAVSAQETEAAFDPTPLVLPESWPKVSRDVTSLDLLEMRQVYGVSISPDGTQVAFVAGQADLASNSYRTALFVVSTTGNGSPISLGSAGLPHWDSINQWESEAPQWSRDSQTVTYRMRPRSDCSWQVWRWDKQIPTLRQMTHVPGNVLRYRWDLSGKKILLEVQPAVPQIPEETLLEHGILYDAQILPWEGMPAILKRLAPPAPNPVIWVHEVETGIEREAADSEKELFEPDLKRLEREFQNRADASAKRCHLLSAKPSPKNASVAVLCSSEENESSPTLRWRFYLMRGDDSHPRELASEFNRVSDYWWSDDGELLYYIATEGDGRAARMMVEEVRSGRTREFFHTADVLREFSMDSARGFIACTRETTVYPAQIAVIDQKGHALITLVDLNPEFKDLRILPAQRISGVNRFGEEWFGHLVRPSGYQPGQRYPLIVTLYRSGDYFLVGASGNENPIQVYAAHGFAVLSFDIGHFHFRKPGDFAGNLLEWASPTASLEMAVEKLVHEGIVDPARVGISGFSHGAEILEFAISHAHLFSAAVESGPAARDPYFYYMAGSNWHDIFAKWGLGGWPDGAARDKWKALAASLNGDRIEAPLLVNAADSEYLASLALCTSLEQLRKPVELFIYPNERHAKNQPKHRYEIYERNLDWFEYWLRGLEDPDPKKANQYLRWRQLRKAWEENKAGH
jgi:dipeptidyl aminopeptidase/acylaminoacyl peptidase